MNRLTKISFFTIISIIGVFFIYYLISEIWYYRFLNGVPQYAESVSESKELDLLLAEYEVLNKESDLAFLGGNSIEEVWLEQFAKFSNDYRKPELLFGMFRMFIKFRSDLDFYYYDWEIEKMYVLNNDSNILTTRFSIGTQFYHKIKKDTIFLKVFKRLPEENFDPYKDKPKNKTVPLGELVLLRK